MDTTITTTHTIITITITTRCHNTCQVQASVARQHEDKW